MRTGNLQEDCRTTPKEDQYKVERRLAHKRGWAASGGLQGLD